MSTRAVRALLAKHPGELALYGALARSRRERGDRVGEIGVYREILAVHEDHHATLLALAVRALGGGRVLADMPRGSYMLRAWHPRYGDVTKRVDVPAREPAVLRFKP